MIQTSSFYDVPTVNVASMNSSPLYLMVLMLSSMKVAGRARQSAFPAVSPVKGDLLIDPVASKIVTRL